MSNETGKIALVTGGNKGIGYQIVQELAKNGYKVVLTARNEARGMHARTTLQEVGLPVEYQPMDVTDLTSIQQVTSWVEREYGHLDVLVNNAGVYSEEDDAIDTVRMDILSEVLNVNTLGPLRVAQAMIALLKKSEQAQIINVSSGYGQLEDLSGGEPAAYKISKAALNVITMMLADELKSSNIKVNSVCPGWVRTDMGGPGATRSVEEGAKGIVELALLGPKAPTHSFLRDLEPIAW